MKLSDKDTRGTLLKFEKSAPEVYESLQELKRTGWVKQGVENPESVKEHTEALIALALELSEHLTEAETNGLVEMLEVHDWPEAVHGDEVIIELDHEKRQALKAVKFENEKRALESICADLSEGEEILNLWLRYETSDDSAAVFGRQLDKYQAIEKALEYEQTQGIDLFQEFMTYCLQLIDHPVLLERIEGLKSKWGATKN